MSSKIISELAFIFQTMDDAAIAKVCREADTLQFVEDKAAEFERTSVEIDRIFAVAVGDRWLHRTAPVVVEIVDVHFDTISVCNVQKSAYFGIAKMDLMRFYKPERGRHR